MTSPINPRTIMNQLGNAQAISDRAFQPYLSTLSPEQLREFSSQFGENTNFLRNSGAREWLTENTRNRFGFSPGDDDFARNTLTALYQENYQDFLTRFRPIQDILYGMVSPEFSQRAGERAQALFTGGYDRGQGSSARQIQSFGLAPSAEQARLSENRRALGEVQAFNQASRGAQDLSALVLGISPRNRIIPEGQG